jgi:hypothetical protein
MPNPVLSFIATSSSYVDANSNLAPCFICGNAIDGAILQRHVVTLTQYLVKSFIMFLFAMPLRRMQVLSNA